MRNFRTRILRIRPIFIFLVTFSGIYFLKGKKSPKADAQSLILRHSPQAEVNFHQLGPNQPQHHNQYHNLHQPPHSHKPALFGEQVVVHSAHKPKIPEWIDWHDYARLEADAKRVGPGEQGNSVPLEPSEHADSAYKENGFNIMVSDRVSPDRSLRDIRHPNCKTRKYLSSLPSTSVIIPFHNEGWSTLIRTLHSLINRTPEQLLHEIILIDDFSSRPWLGEDLESYVKSLSTKILLMRNEKREGLIRTRMTGVKSATGDVIVVLDSHVEVYHNWLPPLLQPIAENRKTIVCPMIDIIDADDFHYIAQPGDAMRGGFDWELWYKRIPIPREKKPKDLSDPFESPVMAGGLFAIDRKYFKELGYYDDGLEIWGGEQYELSFKIWMCGGRMVDAPCSRIGHIYRKFVPYSVPVNGGVNYNFKRVIEVWLDEYKEFFYKRRPYVRHIDCGDLTKAKALRKELQCKSFDWYMKEIIPDLIKYYPTEVPGSGGWGHLRNIQSGLCVSPIALPGKPVEVGECAKDHSMDLQLTWNEDIRPGQTAESTKKKCLDASYRSSEVLIWNCHNQHGNQLWKYRKGQMYHPSSKKCASVTLDGELTMIGCDGEDPSQKWSWQYTNASLLAKFNVNPERSIHGD